jgi:hypothetical protein
MSDAEGLSAHVSTASHDAAGVELVLPLFSNEARELAFTTHASRAALGHVLPAKRAGIQAALGGEGLQCVSDLLLVGADLLAEIEGVGGLKTVGQINESLVEFNKSFELWPAPGSDYAAQLCDRTDQVPAQALSAYPLGKNAGRRITVKNVLDVSFGDKLELPDFRSVWEQALWYAAGFRVAKDRLT